jgi:hypothetical protein
MHLEEAIIINTNGTDHEIAIFQVILDWVVNLKKAEIKVSFKHSKQGQ